MTSDYWIKRRKEEQEEKETVQRCIYCLSITIDGHCPKCEAEK